MLTGNGTTNANLKWLVGDHLGSASVTANSDGTWHSEQRYDPWGEVRWSSGTLPTKYTYTGQYSHMSDPFKLMFYGARWYDSALGRFISADYYVVSPFNPKSFDRYAYSYNNPINYIDPTGFATTSPCITENGYDCVERPPSQNSLGGGLNAIMSLLMPTFTEGINDLLWIVLGVFAETSNGTHSADAIAIKAFALINWRLQNPNLNIIQKIRRATAGIEKAFAGGNPTEKLTNAIACYSNPSACPRNSPNFMKVLEIVEQVYAAILAGEPDPLGGGIFFSDQDDLERINDGVVVETIPDLPMAAGLQTWLESNFAQMQLWYPHFQYALSQPFINPATGKWTIVVGGNHVCVADGDCGAPGYAPSKGAE